MPDQLTITRQFDAPRERVFAAWTDARDFAQWFGTDAVDVPADSLDYDPRPGAEWRAQMRLPSGDTIDWAGDFVEVDAPRRFVFTLTDRPAEPERSAVTVELAEAGEGATEMTMTQQTPGWSDEQLAQLEAGYHGFFDVMARLVAERVTR